MRKQYEGYIDKFLENDFLKHHYECIPFIGEEYEKTDCFLSGRVIMSQRRMCIA